MVSRVQRDRLTNLSEAFSEMNDIASCEQQQIDRVWKYQFDSANFGTFSMSFRVLTGTVFHRGEVYPDKNRQSPHKTLPRVRFTTRIAPETAAKTPPIITEIMRLLMYLYANQNENPQTIPRRPKKEMTKPKQIRTSESVSVRSAKRTNHF